MQINITGRHTTVTDSLRQHAEDKIGKLEKYSDAIEDVRLVLNVEDHRQSAECIFNVKRHGRLVSEGEADDLYTAIDMAADRMERQLKKQKGKAQHARQHHDGLGVESAQQEAAHAKADQDDDDDFDE